MSSYQIGYQGPRVNANFAVTLADNGKGGDRKTWLKAAPQVGTPDSLIIIYIGTNGKPVYLATLDSSGEYVHWADDADALEQAADEYSGGAIAALAGRIASLLVGAGILR